MPPHPTALPVRGHSAEPERRGQRAPLDKVCVRDLVLPMHIGVWSEEQGITQRVRFTVELWMSHAEHQPCDLSSVVSYDFIIDGIKAIVAEGHILLTETLAERIAAHCLTHWRAEKVRVSVEKLDRIPGASLGCEIVRFPARATRGRTFPWDDQGQPAQIRSALHRKPVEGDR